MNKYTFCVYDDEHRIEDRCFDKFEDAYDYAQDGLVTFIFVQPECSGEDDCEERCVWSWDDTSNRDEAIARVNAQLFGLDDCENCAEAENEIAGISEDNYDYDLDLARAMFGDNIEFFDADFDEGPANKIAKCHVCPECGKEICECDSQDKLEEKKGKKKPYSSKTYTTGDPALNIAHFNKSFGGDASSSESSSCEGCAESLDEDDDMTDEEFVEAFGKAMIEKQKQLNK